MLIPLACAIKCTRYQKKGMWINGSAKCRRFYSLKTITLYYQRQTPFHCINISLPKRYKYINASPDLQEISVKYSLHIFREGSPLTWSLPGTFLMSSSLYLRLTSGSHKPRTAACVVMTTEDIRVPAWDRQLITFRDWIISKVWGGNYIHRERQNPQEEYLVLSI